MWCNLKVCIYTYLICFDYLFTYVFFDIHRCVYIWVYRQIENNLSLTVSVYIYIYTYIYIYILILIIYNQEWEGMKLKICPSCHVESFNGKMELNLRKCLANVTLLLLNFACSNVPCNSENSYIYICFILVNVWVPFYMTPSFIPLEKLPQELH